MRGHGVPQFPDPSSTGAFRINGNMGVSHKTMNTAQKACQHLLPNGGVMSPAQLQQAMGRALKYSVCMRGHGITNFPDPQIKGGGISIQINVGSGIDPGSAVFQAAQKACQHLMIRP
jgi:hypothetical protein